MDEGSRDGSGSGGSGGMGASTARSRAQHRNNNGKTSAKLMDYFKRKTHFSK